MNLVHDTYYKDSNGDVFRWYEEEQCLYYPHKSLTIALFIGRERLSLDDCVEAYATEVEEYIERQKLCWIFVTDWREYALSAAISWGMKTEMAQEDFWSYCIPYLLGAGYHYDPSNTTICKTYAHKAIRFALLDYEKRTRKDRNNVQYIDELSDVNNEFPHEFVIDYPELDFLEDLQYIIESLAPLYLRIIKGYAFEGKNCTEIAKEIGTSSTYVRFYLQQGKNMIHDFIRQGRFLQ